MTIPATLKTLFFPMHLHPLVAITFSVLLGIWWQSFGFSFYLPFFIWLCSMIGLLLTEKAYSANVLLWTTSFLIGTAAYQHQCNHYRSWCQKISAAPVNLTLIITDTTTREHPFLKYAATGSIQQITTMQQKILTESPQGNIVIYSAQKLDIEVGDHIKLENATIKSVAHGPLEIYFMKENIGGTVMGNKNLAITLLNRPNFSIMRWIAHLRDAVRDRLKQKLSLRTFNIFSLLFLGNKVIKKKGLDFLRQQFKQWGISHYLARSGLHLVIFIIVWELLLRFIPAPFIIKHLFLLLITCCYALLSWSSISFLRSFLLFIFYKIGIFADTYVNPLHALACITLFLCLLNPMNPFFLDFQLSFGITFLLAWIGQVHTQQNKQALANS